MQNLRKIKSFIIYLANKNTVLSDFVRNFHSSEDSSSKTSVSGIQKAAMLIADTIADKKKILLFGDNDADGICGAALGKAIIEDMGGRIDCALSFKLRAEHGLSAEDVFKAASAGVKLILTVDNGLDSLRAVQIARENGIDVVITDHHQTPEDLPYATSIVTPFICPEDFPSQNLSGAAVLFYVLKETQKILKDRNFFFKAPPKPELSYYMVLAAISTIADGMPLDEINNEIISKGKDLVQKKQCSEGIKYLTAQYSNHSKTFESCLWQIARRIELPALFNYDSREMVDLLLTEYTTQAILLNETLNELNIKKGVLTQKILKTAYTLAAEQNDDNVIVIELPLLEIMIGGFVAQKVRKHFHKQLCIVFCRFKDMYIGYARAAKGLSLIKIFKTIKKIEPELQFIYGGHKSAAGMRINERDLKKFSEILKNIPTLTVVQQ